VRRATAGNPTQLYYDSRGFVVGVTGPLPTDVTYALRWGTEVDGWSCGIAVANGAVYVNLKNGTAKPTAANLVEWFVTELRDPRAIRVPVLPAMAALQQPNGRSRAIARVVGAHEAVNYTHPLETWYGPLPPGRYSLVVWYPHPVTGVMLRSNEYDIELTPGR
jgi:hypothetical protein